MKHLKLKIKQTPLPGILLLLLLGITILGLIPLGNSTRLNAAEDQPPQKPVDRHALEEAPKFVVLERVEELEMYPCSDCHEEEPINRRERKLTEEHENLELDHGGGRFWCITCHGSQNKNTFLLMNDQNTSFNEAYLLCGQCHYDRQKDWYYGAHGKRLETWNGERTLLSCTACHNPHSPSIKPFEPAPPPKVRKGLKLTKWESGKHLPKWKAQAQGGEAH